MNRVLVRSAEYVIGFNLAIVCNQFGINAIGNSAPLANNRGKFTKFAIAIRVSHFFILNEIATNKHENPAANINNDRNKSNITVKLNSARIKPVGITIAIRKTNEHWINAFITVDAYRNENEKQAMYAWNLTAKIILHVDEWKSLFKSIGYQGDYYWFMP